MPAGTDLIYFNASEDWELIVNTSRTAVIINENSHTPINAFDLGVSLNVDYIAVIATTSSKKTTWFFAGDITQSYAFAKGAGSSTLGKVRPPRTRLAIDRLQVVETNRISLDPFRLEYTPPAWFKDCAILVYKYVGQTENFVEDTLFDIGNALGIDPNREDDGLNLRMSLLEQLIIERFDILSSKIDALSGVPNKSTNSGNSTATASGKFTAKQPQDNTAQAYYQGFL